MKSRFAFPLFVSGLLLLAGCNFDSSLTAKPTKNVDPRLLGDWILVDKDTGRSETMQVRQLDKTTYVAALDGDLYSAFHSDFGGLPFLSVQDLNAAERFYLFLTASVSADGRQLTIRTVNLKVIPEKTKGRGALQKLIKANLANPALLEEPLVFNRPPAVTP